jgi:hypothetical protein
VDLDSPAIQSFPRKKMTIHAIDDSFPRKDFSIAPTDYIFVAKKVSTLPTSSAFSRKPSPEMPFPKSFRRKPSSRLPYLFCFIRKKIPLAQNLFLLPLTQIRSLAATTPPVAIENRWNGFLSGSVQDRKLDVVRGKTASLP